MVTRVMIMAGGTGGHVFPALAVADLLRARDVEVCWMGTRRGLESDVVPAAGFPVEWITIAGLRGRGIMGWLAAPFRIAAASLQAFAALRRQRPHVVLGMGGFVTGPGGLMSWVLRIPLVIHEQNAIAGLTNRTLARIATRCLQAFPGSLSEQATTTGNPVRADISAVTGPQERLAGREGAIRLLVLGGSLGAVALNEAVPDALAAIPAEHRPEVWHQAGRRNIEAARAHYDMLNINARVDAFVDDMAAAYAWADVVLCRAGALTIAELAAVGVPAMLVPYPHAGDDHQTVNAALLVDAGAAWLMPQDTLTAEGVRSWLVSLSRTQLRAMAECAHVVGHPLAARDVANVCVELAEGRQ